jgi:hypothetical protein
VQSFVCKKYFSRSGDESLNVIDGKARFARFPIRWRPPKTPIISQDRADVLETALVFVKLVSPQAFPSGFSSRGIGGRVFYRRREELDVVFVQIPAFA